MVLFRWHLNFRGRGGSFQKGITVSRGWISQVPMFGVEILTSTWAVTKEHLVGSYNSVCPCIGVNTCYSKLLVRFLVSPVLVEVLIVSQFVCNFQRLWWFALIHLRSGLLHPYEIPWTLGFQHMVLVSWHQSYEDCCIVASVSFIGTVLALWFPTFFWCWCSTSPPTTNPTTAKSRGRLEEQTICSTPDIIVRELTPEPL